MSVNLQKSDKNTEDQIDSIILSLHEINVADFENSVNQRDYGKAELYFKFTNSFSYKEFIGACTNISSNNDYIYYVKECDTSNDLEARLVFNSEKLSLKKLLAYIVKLEYIPSPVKYKQDKKNDTNASDQSSSINNGESPNSEENIGFVLKVIIDIFIYMKMGIFYIIKFVANIFITIIKDIAKIIRFIFKAIIEIFKFIIYIFKSIMEIFFDYYI